MYWIRLIVANDLLIHPRCKRGRLGAIGPAHGHRKNFYQFREGKKDRTTILAENIRSLIQKYLKEYKPDDWLLEGPLKEPDGTPGPRRYGK